MNRKFFISCLLPLLILFHFNLFAQMETLNGNYEYLVPEGWKSENLAGYVLLQNPQSGCAIRILAPQPSSGSLEQDVNAVFDLMYPPNTWRYQEYNRSKFTLSKGFLFRGLEFHMKEATMSSTANGLYSLEEGAAVVVKAGNQIVIISIRHSGLLAHGDCVRKYNTVRRFINSFHVKNAAIPSNSENSNSKIIGAWSQAEAGASSEYVFAANGHYAMVGALGSTSTSSDLHYEYLHIKTWAFDGDGSYRISGSKLILARRGSSEEEKPIHFDQVNRDGTNWIDRLYMLSSTPFGLNEVCYEKK